MPKKSKKSLDLFKERALSCLALKGDEPGKYPIHRTDLVYTKKCAVCGSGSTSVLTEVYLADRLNFLTTEVCNDCLFVFRSVSPSLRWFKKCWKKIKTEAVEVFNPEIEAIRKIRYEKYHRILSKHVNSGNVLDIGAGYGTGSQIFKERGYEVESLEPEDNKARYIRQALGIQVYQKSIESFLSNPPKKRYDLIIFAHCLEHLDNPGSVLSHLKRILKPLGLLYIDGPVLWNYVTWSDALYLTHKSNFGEEHLINFVQNHSFKILEKTHIRHSPKEAFDFGLVLKADPYNKIRTPDNPPMEHTLDEIFKLYRKNLLIPNLPQHTKLVYSVPHIEQFYCTLRLKDYIPAISSANIITFEYLDK